MTFTTVETSWNQWEATQTQGARTPKHGQDHAFSRRSFGPREGCRYALRQTHLTEATLGFKFDDQKHSGGMYHKQIANQEPPRRHVSLIYDLHSIALPPHPRRLLTRHPSPNAPGAGSGSVTDFRCSIHRSNDQLFGLRKMVISSVGHAIYM